MSDLSSNPLTVAIIGGSLSGLFAGLAIRSLGHKVHILERHSYSELIDQGAGLRIGPDVYAFLRKYVPQAELDACMVLSDGVRVLDRKGHVTSEVKMVNRVTSWGSLHRLCLAELRRSAGDSFVFDHDCTFESLDGAGEKVEIRFVKNDSRQRMMADLVIGADGPSSRVRQCFLPDVQRKYVGYVCWRGTVPESELSAGVGVASVVEATYHWGEDFMVLNYPIPGADGSVEVGKRLVNWVWYHNTSDATLDKVMTDINGVRHNMTIARGKMRAEVIDRQKKMAAEVMPHQFATLIKKTKRPFVQLVTDMISPENTFLEGRVLLVGESAAGPRPHVAASTSQAVFHVSKLKNVFEGTLTIEQWGRQTAKMSLLLYEAGRDLGPVCQSTAVKVEDKFGVFTKKQADLYGEIASIGLERPPNS